MKGVNSIYDIDIWVFFFFFKYEFSIFIRKAKTTFDIDIGFYTVCQIPSGKSFKSFTSIVKLLEKGESCFEISNLDFFFTRKVFLKNSGKYMFPDQYF